MPVRALLLVAALASGALAAPAQAQTDVYQHVQSVYERYGSIPPCMFTSAQLEKTLRGVDTYGAQYFADFTNAVNAALTARASGECASGASATRRTGLGAGSEAGLPSSPTSPTQAGLPGAIGLLAGLTCVLAAVGAALSAGSRRRWAAGLGHGLAEAGYRLGGGWETARDVWRELALRRRPRR